MDFKTQFFNLNGVHYKEVKTSFYKLLHGTDPLVLIHQLPEIQPKNHLQRIFYVDILIRAKQVKALVNILEEGNMVLVSKILKEKWFFEEVVKAMSARDIVNDFLPTLSYPVKMKVLKKLALSLSEARMDNVYDCLLERYGLFIAKQFLFSCSAPKIQQVLRDNEITLSVEQLKRLLAKNSDLIKSYMESYKNNFGHDFDNYRFLSYVAAKHPQLYFEFGMQHIDHVKVGRQTTKSLLRLNKDEALKNEKTVLARLNNSVVARQVQEQHLHKYLPEKLNISSTVLAFLKKFPQKKRMSILSIVFQNIHNDDILNHLALFENNSFAAVFPKDVRRTWAQLLFEQTNHFVYVTHFECKDGFPLIKRKIELTAKKDTRHDLLVYLIRMCHANKDYHYYEEVLRYISIRHRNEYTFFRLLSEIGQLIDNDLTTDGFWDAVKDLVQLARAKGDPPPSQLLTRHLIYLYNKKLPVEEALELFMSYPQTEWHHFKLEPVIKKHMLEKSLELVAGGNLQGKQAKLLKIIFKQVVEFNAIYPDQLIKLNECATVIKCIRQLIRDDDNKSFRLWMTYNNNCHWNSETILKIGTNDEMLTTIKCQCSKAFNDDVLVDAIIQPRNSAIQENLLVYFFKHCVYNERYSYALYSEQQRALKHFLEKEPLLIGKYFYQIIKDGRGCHGFNDYSIFKLYNHLGLDSKLVESFSPLVSASIEFEYKSTVISALSQLMSTNDFLALIAEYIPRNTKLDIHDKNQKQLYSTQCDIAKCLKNLEDVVPLVPLLEYFCRGDYFQASCRLLYNVLYRVSEKQATDIIKLLMRKAVSVRKHAAYFGFALANHSTAIQVIQWFNKDESVRKYVTKGLFQYCIKNPTLPTLDMLLACFDYISMDDTELIETLIGSSPKLPKHFQPSLMMKLWTAIEQYAQRFGPNWMQQIGRFTDDMFLKFPEPFCGQVIGKYFLSKIDFDGINTFVCMYLSVYQDQMHFIEVFSKISKYKELHWNSNNYNEQNKIFSFFAQAYKMFPNRPITFLNLFKDHWERLFSYEDCFAENVGLDFMLIYVECPRIEEFGKKLHVILHGMINVYGTYINHLLLDGLTFLFKQPRVFGLCQVALQLLEIEPTELNCFLAINIAERASLPTEAKEQKALLSCLKTVDYFYVKVRYNTLKIRPSKP